jgi:serine/threonine protein kinase
MASIGGLGRLSEDEYADLNNRVDSFYQAWKPDGSVPLHDYLPPPSAAHRQAVLIELIKTDMELRAKAGLTFRVEFYLDQFSAELSLEQPPVSLLAEEYRLRHCYADKPTIQEYFQRFPAISPSLLMPFAGGAPLESQRVASEPQAVGSIGLESLPLAKSPPALEPAAPTAASSLAGQTRPSPLPKKPSDSSGSRSSASALGAREADILPAGVEYKLIRRIGEGAFGEVYEALAPGGFKVAIKRIRRDVNHPASQSELESLEAIRNLSHPFLLQTHFFWVLEDRLILVMELAEGSLADRIKHYRSRQQLGVPPEELIPFFEQVAAALDYLHSQKVSHRDVKPENLLVLKGYAKVADFGLARTQEHVMTTVGYEVGTPAYMAPEVCYGKVSLHSDQYSLAATYVAARLGRYLFPAKSRREMEDHHQKSTPNLDPLPKDEQRVLLKALSKKPADRYPSCGAFVRALRDAVLSPPKPPQKKSRILLLVNTLTALLAVLLSTVLVWMYLHPSPVPDKREVLPDAWVPVGWSPLQSVGTEVIAGKPYWKQLTRTVAGEELVALLIPPTQPSDPPPFYMLQNKLSNRVFQELWDKASENPGSALKRFETSITFQEQRAWLLPGLWRHGATDLEGRQLGIAGEQATVPVVGVTVPEAILIANELGGLLPTYLQWLKAVGMSDRHQALDPAGPIGPDVQGDVEHRRRQLQERELALGLKTGPWPVTKPTRDRTCWGVHQLLSNGAEWVDFPKLKNEPWRPTRIQLATVKPEDEWYFRMVGTSWEMPSVLTFQHLSDENLMNRPVPWVPWNRTEPWDGQSIGFRVVLEPPQEARPN